MIFATVEKMASSPIFHHIFILYQTRGYGERVHPRAYARGVMCALNEAIYADLDYQYYYEPAIEDLRECFTEKILEDAKSFLENNFYNWLNKYESEDSK